MAETTETPKAYVFHAGIDLRKRQYFDVRATSWSEACAILKSLADDPRRPGIWARLDLRNEEEDFDGTYIAESIETLEPIDVKDLDGNDVEEYPE
jgi:hypothetical protein